MTALSVPRLASLLTVPRGRLVAMALLVTTIGIASAFLIVRGSQAGADALAYWEGVRIWLGGGDPYDPPGVRLAYLYAPWLLPLFLPWALLPWSVAWFAWRTAMVLGFAWSVAWAYRRRPGWTAILVTLLAIPLTATFDTGNVTLFLALGVWAAQTSGARLGGALWALATAMKLVPVVLWLILPRRTRAWGLAWLAVAVLLSLATWPQTLVQLEAAAASGPAAFPRPLRIDHAVLLWAAVPWLWRGDAAGRVRDALRAARQWWPGSARDALRTLATEFRSALSDGAPGAGAGRGS